MRLINDNDEQVRAAQDAQDAQDAQYGQAAQDAQDERAAKAWRDEQDERENRGYQFSPVGEVFIDFTDGEISGNCDDCSADDVADAFERIARRLRTFPSTPNYVDFDEGKFFSQGGG